MTIPTYTGDIPYLTTAQMIEVDRAMVEDYKIELIQMMENAGRNLAHLARERFLNSDPLGKKVVVLAGTGGNGGGGLVCARHLHIYGVQVNVFITKPDIDFAPVVAHQLDILQRMKIPVAVAADVQNSTTQDLIVDGIIGYSLKGAPRGTAKSLIRWANSQKVPILSLDVPSGIDATSGKAYDTVIKAHATLTLALPKEGLRAVGVEAKVGELYLANISVPAELYAESEFKLSVGPIFAQSDIIRLRNSC
jgi:NAD(P)H-hydrate epimerase